MPKTGASELTVILLSRDQLASSELALELGERGLTTHVVVDRDAAVAKLIEHSASVLVAEASGEQGPFHPAELAALARTAGVPWIALIVDDAASEATLVVNPRPASCLHRPINDRDLWASVRLAAGGTAGRSSLAPVPSRRRRDLADLALRSAHTAVVVTDREGRITLFNPAAERLTGYEAEQVRGQRAREVLKFRDGGSRQRQKCIVERALAERAPVSLAANTLLERRTGELVWVEDGAAPVDPADGDGAVLFIRDVTERRAGERRTRENERLAALGTLAAGMAHQVNNPLMCLTTNLTDMRDALEKSAQGSQPLGKQTFDDGVSAMNEALEGVKRVRKVVTDLMTYARREQPSDASSPIDVGAVIQSALQIVSGEYAKRIRTITIVRDPPKVWAHEPRLVQVIVNLLVNAAQAIKPDRTDGEVSIAAHGAGAWTLIEVRDNGDGISDGVLKRVFEPFFTTKAVGRGTGLGLAISRALVEAMGGDLSVESHPGVGTVFRMAIPAVAPDPEEIGAASPTDHAPAPVRAGRVLLADDENAVQQVFGRFLAHEGWEVKSASTAADALAALAQGESYDAIVCSLALPDLSGAELFERAIKERPELARTFVFVSSGTMTDSIRDQIARTGLPVLSKPLTMSELMVPLGDLSNARVGA